MSFEAVPRLIGAVLAGGAARRFGSDKALAPLAGKPLIEHVIERLAGQCDAVVVVGRDHPGLTSLPDRPRPGLGPLAGLNAALAYAAAEGFDAILTCGCDLPGVPRDAAARLGPAPAVAAGQPLVGLWPAALAAEVAAYLAGAASRSLWRCADHFGARRVDLGVMANVNTPSDLDGLDIT